MFGKDVPYISLNSNWGVVDAHNSIAEKYPVMLKPGYFSNLMSGYTAEYFNIPVVMAAPGVDLSGMRLVFALDGNLIKCYPLKNEIYSGMADRNVQYQMREPVTNIFALMPVIADAINKGDDLQAVSLLEDINKQSYRLLKNTTNITMVSKILSGELPRIENVNFSSLLDSLVSSVKAVQRNIKINVDIEDDIYIIGNMQFLSTAILNLISNSINFSSAKSVNIEIILKEEKGRAVFSYKDNSKGIKDQYLTDVFKPYFSKDPFADGETDPSMGLGLFIAKTALEQTGGNLILTSKFGQGVKYTISIPIENEAENVLESSSTDFLLNRYSPLFVQLCESCRLPDLK